MGPVAGSDQMKSSSHKPVSDEIRTAKASDAATGRALKRRILFAISTGWGYRSLAVASNFVMTWLMFRYLGEEALGVWFLM